ncbi:hypothetical protein B5F87_10915 [Eubacterium sp. An3]|nr:hypothetical protein B5F87_10915 [Eubacterium sp. An3]
MIRMADGKTLLFIVLNEGMYVNLEILSATAIFVKFLVIEISENSKNISSDAGIFCIYCR